ncbi:MAG: SelL-related redox protein [Myxococcota bacterium]
MALNPKAIDAAVLDQTVAGVNLVPGSLRDQLSASPTLLVFLRHFGCIFCREAIADLRAASEENAEYPSVLFFAQARPTEIRAFLRRYWPAARAIADPELQLYEAFGVGRASFLQALGPSVLRASSRARAKGHEGGPRSGDIWRMPGVMWAEETSILWSYEPEHAADHPDFAAIPELVAEERG